MWQFPMPKEEKETPSCGTMGGGGVLGGWEEATITFLEKKVRLLGAWDES